MLRHHKVEEEAPSKGKYQFRIVLQDTKPPVWRRIVVPGNINMEDFGLSILAAMGWENCHLTRFFLPGEPPVVPEDDIIPNTEGEKVKMSKSRKYRYDYLVCNDKNYLEYDDGALMSELLVQDAFNSRSRTAVLVYDLGDNWKHLVELEKKIEKGGPEVMRCIAGNGACPPEDCGGVGFYEDLLKALKTPEANRTFDQNELIEIVDGWEPTPFKADFDISPTILGH